ncbi:MAG: hypothetical protein EYC70_15810 [Planctomycetota bacterium]|nr:MAG: hypothetical protein EYC70_15810 [Planctomycetota bacterium]
MATHILAFAALAAPVFSQTLQPYDYVVQPQLSAASFGGGTSIGPIQGNPDDQFRLGGLLATQMGPPGGPFTAGELLDAHAFTIPATLYGRIPNPIPHLPPLAEIEITDSVWNMISSGQFAIDASGDFTATVTMMCTHGTLVLRYLGTTTVFNLAGAASNATATAGRSYAQGGVQVLELDLDMDLPFADPITGISGTVHIDGTLGATSSVLDAPLVLRVNPLSAGVPGLFSVTGAQPGALTFLAYGLRGLGLTDVPQLGVTLGIQSPVQAGGAIRALGNGTATWSLTVPFPAQGRTMRFQAAQAGAASNVWLTTVL